MTVSVFKGLGSRFAMVRPLSTFISDHAVVSETYSLNEAERSKEIKFSYYETIYLLLDQTLVIPVKYHNQTVRFCPL